MSSKIGRFEILSQIAHSDATAVYKATDSENAQTVALKTLNLQVLGDQARSIMDQVNQEAEAAKVLNSPNIAGLYGVGDIDQFFCASMEYVQGNSIATMLARKEGFSIWDLQDITRQTCQGLDHAHAKNIFHYTLEPAKIMVQWEGTVKILSFGMSTMTAFAAQAVGTPPEVLHYMSPEQLHGDPLDARSNIFSLGAILYEMVTDQKPFQGAHAEEVRQQVLEQAPVPPAQINRKIHPVLSDLIMKALAKAPEERYQSGQELVNDLEKCKESATKAAAKAAAPGLAAPAAVKPAPVAAKPPASAVPAVPVAKKSPVAVTPQTPPKAAAAAAGAGNAGSTAVSKLPATPRPATPPSPPQPKMSDATVEPEVEMPKIALDPMMDESASPAGSGSRSFSDIDELPPLKEVYVAPQRAPEPVADVPATPGIKAPVTPEKPKVQPREVAKKAVAEIKKTPPQLFMYSIVGAVAVILLIVAAIAFRIHSENSEFAEDTSAPAAASTSTPQAAAQPQTTSPTPALAVTTPAETAPDVVESSPSVSVKSKHPARKKGRTVAQLAPAIVPGQLTVNSTPEGAQVQVDGLSDPTWVTPFNLSGLAPGQHTATISKAGYASQTRSIEVGSGSKSSLAVQLAPTSGTLSVNSDPAGAEILIDGKSTGHVTPAKIALDKAGNHTVTVRKQGYLDETSAVNVQLGQTLHYGPALRALGRTDDIKMAGRFKKIFHGGDTEGTGTVSVKTDPKGAQVAINQRILDKRSPLEFYLNPGNYEVDITLSGYKSLHKVISVEKDGKVSIEESLQRE